MALGIFHPDLAAFDPADSPRSIPKQEHVTRQTFDGKVLVDRADKCLLWVEDDIVVGVIGDGPAAGHGGDRRAASRLDP